MYLTDEKCTKRLESAAVDHNRNVHAFVMVGLHTGMRHQEILSIRREHVNFGKRMIWLPKAKAGSRERPITKEVADYPAKRIDVLPPGSEWLFPSLASTIGHVHTIRKAFRRSVLRAGLNPSEITPRPLDHTAITHLAQAGVDLPIVQRISAHKTLSIVARYVHQSGSHIGSAIYRLEECVSTDREEKVVKLRSKKPT